MQKYNEDGKENLQAFPSHQSDLKIQISQSKSSSHITLKSYENSRISQVVKRKCKKTDEFSIGQSQFIENHSLINDRCDIEKEILNNNRARSEYDFNDEEFKQLKFKHNFSPQVWSKVQFKNRLQRLNSSNSWLNKKQNKSLNKSNLNKTSSSSVNESLSISTVIGNHSLIRNKQNNHSFVECKIDEREQHQLKQLDKELKALILQKAENTKIEIEKNNINSQADFFQQMKLRQPKKYAFLIEVYEKESQMIKYFHVKFQEVLQYQLDLSFKFSKHSKLTEFEWPNLTMLKMNYCLLGNKDWQALVDNAKKFPDLQEIYLGNFFKYVENNFIEHVKFQQLLKFHHAAPRLRNFSFFANPINFVNFDEIHRFMESFQIIVQLGDNQFNDLSFSHFLQLPQNRKKSMVEQSLGMKKDQNYKKREQKIQNKKVLQVQQAQFHEFITSSVYYLHSSKVYDRSSQKNDRKKRMDILRAYLKNVFGNENLFITTEKYEEYDDSFLNVEQISCYTIINHKSSYNSSFEQISEQISIDRGHSQLHLRELSLFSSNSYIKWLMQSNENWLQSYFRSLSCNISYSKNIIEGEKYDEQEIQAQDREEIQFYLRFIDREKRQGLRLHDFALLKSWGLRMLIRNFCFYFKIVSQVKSHKKYQQ